MAYTITELCTSCGDCLPLCPNQAIHERSSRYSIDAAYCTECLGYSDEPECVAACPESVIVPLRINRAVPS